MTHEEIIIELKEKFPLLTYKIGQYGVEIHDKHGYMSCDEITDQVLNHCYRENKRQEVENELQAKYPNLVFYIDMYSFKPSALYVRRDGRDAEAIDYIVQDDPPYMQNIMLQHFNIEAGKALQPGWFFCTGCGEAKPESEYGYFYFAGNYCKQCMEENPEHYRRAMNESYN